MAQQLSFRWSESAAPFRGQLLYLSGDQAVDFRPTGEQEKDPAFWDMGCSIALQTLQIHIACGSGTLLFPRGYFPRGRWREGTLPRIRSRPGVIQVEHSGGFKPGVAVGFQAAEGWPVLWDANAGWLRFGNDGLLAGDFIEFAEGVVAVIGENALSALWLRVPA